MFFHFHVCAVLKFMRSCSCCACVMLVRRRPICARARAGRKHGAAFDGCERSRGLLAASAGCRRRQGGRRSGASNLSAASAAAVQCLRLLSNCGVFRHTQSAFLFVYLYWWNCVLLQFVCMYCWRRRWHIRTRAQDGWTALIVAGFHGHADCARLLLDAGADKDAKDEVRERAGGGACGALALRQC